MSAASGTAAASGTSAASGTAAAHAASLERAYSRIVAVAAGCYVVQFWLSSATAGGPRAGSLVCDLALSVLLIGMALRWGSGRLPRQRELGVLAVTAGVLLPAARIFAVPGSAYLTQTSYLLVAPVADAWAVFARRLVVPVPLLLTILATGAWRLSGELPVEQSVTTLAIAAFAGLAARLMRAGARQADADANELTRQIAEQDAATAAEQAAQRVKSTVHDDVLSVLRAIGDPHQRLAWNVVVGKARQAQAALAQQLAGDRGGGSGGLGELLRRQAAEFAPVLDVRLHVEADLEVPAGQAAAVSAAVGEALRNTAAHAGVDTATVTARTDTYGNVQVTVADAGVGFDPRHVPPGSLGLRESISARLRDAGGTAEVIASPANGTTIVLTLHSAPAQPRAGASPADPFDWARRASPPPLRVFLGFMAPPLLSSLVLLCLRWDDLRWHAAGLAVFAGLLVVTAASAPSVSRARMAPSTATAMIAALTALTAAGALAVAPGTKDAFAYWVSGESAVLVTALYYARGPAAGLTAMALDLGALSFGLSVTGRGIPAGEWPGILASPVLAAGLGVGFRMAFASLSRHTELQLADYRDTQRRRARAAAISQADTSALESARRIAGPVLDRVASGEPPTPAVRAAARMASDTLRDELLAPGFLGHHLAERVNAARVAGVAVTVEAARGTSSSLTDAARNLLAAALGPPAALTGVTLQLHPPMGAAPATLLLHLRGCAGPDATALRDVACDCGALVTDLGARELLVWLQEVPAQPKASPPKGGVAPARELR